MSANGSELLIRKYYDAFNRADTMGMAALLHEGVEHDINQGKREIGKQVFIEFLNMMDFHYREQAKNLVVMVDPTGKRCAAEFVIEGVYKKTAEGLPPANNQTYELAVGAFFEIRDNLIFRVTNYYNLDEWIRQVSQ